MKEEWKSFKGGNWVDTIDVENFIESNYKEYLGDEKFLEGTTKRTDAVWGKCLDLLKEEHNYEI
jgi:formate C-acetyltransferase